MITFLELKLANTTLIRYTARQSSRASSTWMGTLEIYLRPMKRHGDRVRSMLQACC